MACKRRCLWALIPTLLLFGARPALSQDAEKTSAEPQPTVDEIRVVKLQLHPQPEPRYALQ